MTIRWFDNEKRSIHQKFDNWKQFECQYNMILVWINVICIYVDSLFKKWVIFIKCKYLEIVENSIY